MITSYTYMYDDSELFDDEEGTIAAPFDSAIRQYELNKDDL